MRLTCNNNLLNVDGVVSWTDYTDNGVSQTDATNGQNELIASTISDSITNHTFDNAGNTLEDVVPGSGSGTIVSATYSYDAWNRMVGASVEGEDETLSYDANGRQITGSSDVSGDTVNYYSTSGQVLETDTTGTVTVVDQYVWGIDYVNHLIERDSANPTGGTSGIGFSTSDLDYRIYAITDANYNVTGLVDTSANVLERFQFTAYGIRSELTADYVGLGSDAYGFSPGWQGGMTDPLTGLVHFDARNYNPVTGRWMEQDPTEAAYVDGASLYQFADSNPIGYGDPTGLLTASISLGWGLGIKHWPDSYYKWHTKEVWQSQSGVTLDINGTPAAHQENGKTVFQGAVNTQGSSKGGNIAGPQRFWKSAGAKFSDLSDPTKDLNHESDSTHCVQVEVATGDFDLVEPDETQESIGALVKMGVDKGKESLDGVSAKLFDFFLGKNVDAGIKSISGGTTTEVHLVAVIGADGTRWVGATGIPAPDDRPEWSVNIVGFLAVGEDLWRRVGSLEYGAWIHADPGGATNLIRGGQWSAAG